MMSLRLVSRFTKTLAKLLFNSVRNITRLVDSLYTTVAKTTGIRSLQGSPLGLTNFIDHLGFAIEHYDIVLEVISDHIKGVLGGVPAQWLKPTKTTTQVKPTKITTIGVKTSHTDSISTTSTSHKPCDTPRVPTIPQHTPSQTNVPETPDNTPHGAEITAPISTSVLATPISSSDGTNTTTSVPTTVPITPTIKPEAAKTTAVPISAPPTLTVVISTTEGTHYILPHHNTEYVIPHIIIHGPPLRPEDCPIIRITPPEDNPDVSQNTTLPSAINWNPLVKGAKILGIPPKCFKRRDRSLWPVGAIRPTRPAKLKPFKPGDIGIISDAGHSYEQGIPNAIDASHLWVPPLGQFGRLDDHVAHYFGVGRPEPTWTAADEAWARLEEEWDSQRHLELRRQWLQRFTLEPLGPVQCFQPAFGMHGPEWQGYQNHRFGQPTYYDLQVAYAVFSAAGGEIWGEDSAADLAVIVPRLSPADYQELGRRLRKIWHLWVLNHYMSLERIPEDEVLWTRPTTPDLQATTVTSPSTPAGSILITPPRAMEQELNESEVSGTKLSRAVAQAATTASFNPAIDWCDLDDDDSPMVFPDAVPAASVGASPLGLIFEEEEENDEAEIGILEALGESEDETECHVGGARHSTTTFNESEVELDTSAWE